MTVAPVLESPWKGLAPFEDNHLDALLFFGRNREQEVIASNLIAARLTVLYGPSGVGKSSVLRAGVAYGLRVAGERSIEERGHPDAAVVVFDDWRGDPVSALRARVEEELARLFGSHAVPDVAPEADLPEAFVRWTSELDVDLLLVLDQLEEYFVYHEREQRERFAEQLPELVTARGLRVNLLLSLREDALAKLDRFKAEVPGLFSNYLRLDRLAPSAAREAVKRPLERYNERVGAERSVAIEPALVDAVVEQTTVGRVHLGGERYEPTNGARADGVEPAYLQLVLARVWDEEVERGSRVLRLSTLEQLGRADAIVRNHVRDALDDLDPGQRDIAATIFNYLVTPSGTKIAHSVRDLEGYADAPPAYIDSVVRALARERVLRPVAAPGEGNGHSAGYEIYHDVLANPLIAWRRRHEEERTLANQRREAARRQRVLGLLTASALAVAAVMVAVTVYALSQRSQAREQGVSAQARELTAHALAQLESDPELSVLLSLEAVERERTRSVEEVLRSSLLASHARDVLRGHGGAVRAVAVDRERMVTTVDASGTVRRFSGGRARTEAPLGADVSFAAFDALAERVLIGGRFGARLLDTASGRNVAGGLVHDEPVRRVAVSADGRTAAVLLSQDVVLIRKRSGALIEVSVPPRVSSLWLSADGTRLVYTHSQFAVVRIVGRRRPVVTITDRATLFDAELSPDGTLLATAAADGAARVWDTKTGELRNIFVGHGNFATGVSFSHDGNWLVTTSPDRTARTWDAENARPVAVLSGHRGPVTTAAFGPDGGLVTASDDGTARLWESGVAPELRRLYGGPGWSRKTDAEFAGGSGTVVIGDVDWAVDVLERGEPVDGFGVGAPVDELSITADGRLLVAVAGGGAEVVRLPAGTSVRALGAAVSADIAADGGAVAVGMRSGRARVVELAGRPRTRVLRGEHDGAVTSVDLSPDGTHVATGSEDHTARVWDRASGGVVHELPGHSDVVTDVTFSPDGRLLATSSRDHDVRLWDVETGRLVRVLQGHFAVVSEVAFSPDARWIVTAGPETAGLWRTGTGRLLMYLRGHEGVLTSASFDPAGRRIVTASVDGTIRLYDCEICAPTAGLVALAHRRLAATGRALTQAERRAYLHER